ncbi:apoptosis inhibitor 5-like protein API5 [Magnolia sinica]|uniref:apoptosis inhibitor 5-like protein API5 n=1 Tax=Magnolia sinica TaxID=86752 RepID=UPI00265971F7|nr:apoptosis inhibitor 5-like protein API5 [Magnolia sinica]
MIFASSLHFYFGLLILLLCQLPEERKLDLLKSLAECSPHTTPQDSCQLLPSVVRLLMTPIAMNSLRGYKIVTGQPSDRLGEDFSDQYKDFTERQGNKDLPS